MNDEVLKTDVSSAVEENENLYKMVVSTETTVRKTREEHLTARATDDGRVSIGISPGITMFGARTELSPADAQQFAYALLNIVSGITGPDGAITKTVTT